MHLKSHSLRSFGCLVHNVPAQTAPSNHHFLILSSLNTKMSASLSNLGWPKHISFITMPFSFCFTTVAKKKKKNPLQSGSREFIRHLTAYLASPFNLISARLVKLICQKEVLQFLFRVLSLLPNATCISIMSKLFLIAWPRNIKMDTAENKRTSL